MLLNAFRNQSILPVSPYLFLLIFQAIKTFSNCVTDICKSRTSATFFLALDTKGLSTAWLVCA